MNNFSKLGIREELVSAVQDLGFENPTPIQEKVIPMLVQGSADVVALAQTGTGKTAAFGLPMLSRLDVSQRHTQALVICPTRELCLQITNDFTNFTKYLPGIHVVAVYGGASIDRQISSLKKGAQVIVATPGRLIDLINRKAIKLENIEMVVLDEADEMLNMGFQEDINDILSYTPEEKTTWLFSATMPKEVAKIAKNYMTNPIEISAGVVNSSAENIEHIYYVVRDRDRYKAVKSLIDFNPTIFGLIFCRTKIETQKVASQLMQDGYNAEALHGDLSQSQRDQVMKKFRDRTLQILVATDVAARGIDVDKITHVINYNLPDDIENYTHRSGRTARAGQSGKSLVLVNAKEVFKIRSIEKQIKTSFKAGTIPTGEEICAIRINSLVADLLATEVKEKEIAEYLPIVLEQFERFSKEDIIKKFVSNQFNQFLEYYKNSGDLNATLGREERTARGRDSRDDSNMVQLHLNGGELDDLNTGAIIRLVCNTAGITSTQIGRVKVMREFSFIDVDSNVADQVLNQFQNIFFNNRDLSVQVSKSKAGGSSSGFGGGSRERSRVGFNKGGFSGSRNGSNDRKSFSKSSVKSGGSFKSGNQKKSSKSFNLKD
ncbi:MAG: DEAD/DEAH box helicase [Flavobacteriales bacterium]